jgi:hypothetical protein
MKLTIRACQDCGSKFDLIEDKYFYKRPSKLKMMMEITIKTLIPTIMNKRVFDPKLICESCNRNDKLKDLGV